MTRLDRILELARAHRPDLRLVPKSEVPWMRALGVVLSPIVPDFMTAFTTVIGDTIYLPRPVDQIEPSALAVTLAHEHVHQLDQEQYGLWFYASYLLVLPVVRTRRAHWERRAYGVDLMLAYEMGGASRMDRVFESLVSVFSGSSYAWMWAGREAARAYLEPMAEEIRAGTLQERAPYRGILAAWRSGEEEAR